MKKLNSLDIVYEKYYKEYLKDAKYIIMNKQTYDELILEIESILPIKNPTNGKVFYRGIEVLIKNEVETNKFIII